MTLKMYSVYDRVAKSFDTPFFARSDDEVKRQFSLQLVQPNAPQMLIRYPDDFEIVRIGCFDTDSGVIGNWPDTPDDELVAVPALVCRLSVLISSSADPDPTEAFVKSLGGASK